VVSKVPLQDVKAERERLELTIAQDKELIRTTIEESRKDFENLERVEDEQCALFASDLDYLPRLGEYNAVMACKDKVEKISGLLVKQLGLSYDYREKLIRLLPCSTPNVFFKFKKGLLDYYDVFTLALNSSHKFKGADLMMKECGIDPIEFAEKYEQKMIAKLKLKFGVDDINKVSVEKMLEPSLPHHDNQRCFKSIYQFTWKQP
jgi:hypothetical protein